MAQAKALFLVEVAPYKSSKRELHTVLKDGRCTGGSGWRLQAEDIWYLLCSWISHDWFSAVVFHIERLERIIHQGDAIS